MKASAVAHPIQGLIKYHGLVDEKLRIPFHDSISVCTAPLETRTTVEFGGFPADTAAINGHEVDGRDMERIEAVVDAARQQANSDRHFRMVSENNFPSNVGLGASASGFAALAVAAAAALDLKLPPRDLSRLARRGAASAARAVTGGFSVLRRGTGDEDTAAECLAGPDLAMGIVVALVPAFKLTDTIHREVRTSPLFPSRVAEMPRLVAEMELAIRKKDVGAVMALAERDTLMLHGITMTGTSEVLLWQPETLAVIHEVRRMRDEGLPAFFSIDTGATVYVNTFPDKVDQVEERVKRLVPTMRCEVGGAARVVDTHLF